GGGGTPGGSNSQIQYNNSGSFGGATGFTYNSTNQSLAISGAAISGGANLVTWTPGAHTNVGAEVNDLFIGAHTVTISGGFGSERFTWLRSPTITASANNLPISTGATLAIEGAPKTSAAGGFTPTIGTTAQPNSLALWIQGGSTTFGAHTTNFWNSQAV